MSTLNGSFDFDAPQFCDLANPDGDAANTSAYFESATDVSVDAVTASSFQAQQTTMDDEMDKSELDGTMTSAVSAPAQHDMSSATNDSIASKKSAGSSGTAKAQARTGSTAASTKMTVTKAVRIGAKPSGPSAADMASKTAAATFERLASAHTASTATRVMRGPASPLAQTARSHLSKSKASPPKSVRSTRSMKSARSAPAAAAGGAALKLTVPKSPVFHGTSRKFRKQVLSREELDLIEAQRGMEALKKHRAEAAKTMRKAMQGAAPAAAPSTRKLVEPKAFHFRTDERINKTHTMTTRSDDETLPRPVTARPVGASSAAATSGADTQRQRVHFELTEPKPFTFHIEERLKRRHEQQQMESPKEFHSTAEMVRRFETATPQRFRTSKRGQQYQPDLASSQKRVELTVPTTPKLAVVTRHRSPDYKGHDVQEEEELANMPKFRARKLDRRVLESAGDLGVPRVQKQPLTEPVEVHLHTQDRAQVRPSASSAGSDADASFKARPMPEFPTPKAKPREHEVVVPGDVELATDRRAKLRGKASASDNETSFEFHARPMPRMDTPLAAREQPHSDKPLTEPAAFSLRTELRGEMARRKEREAVKHAEEEAKRAREFHARPIVSYVSAPVQVEHRPLTEPQPFNLESEARHEHAVQQIMLQRQQEEEEERRAREFHARPVQTKVFKPKKAAPALIQIDEFDLNSDRRAQEREAFDNMVRAKEAEVEAQRAIQKAMEEEKQRQEIVELRRKMVPKAQPVPKALTRPFQPKPSQAPLTEPQSPMLRTRMRA